MNISHGFLRADLKMVSNFELKLKSALVKQSRWLDNLNDSTKLSVGCMPIEKSSK